MTLQESKYLSGFGNHHQSEALPGALPTKQNSPQKIANELYAEQINGSAFTAPRTENLKSWLYRIAPSVMHEEFSLYKHPSISSVAFMSGATPPNQMRWFPLDYPRSKIDFISGLHLWAFNGNSLSQTGAAIYLYTATSSMIDTFFYSSDGEFLIVPQDGELQILTEFGEITVSPCEIAVIPRGVKFQVNLLDDKAKGYALENFGSPLKLPDLGPIGANGLANPRHFLFPKANYFNEQGNFYILNKFQNNIWRARTKVNPLNVVAWQGNYAPYKYDLNLFNTINTVSFDHPDPSIFTVLTSQTTKPGTANLDFVIFPPRWMVAENTFRPPYYHRNIMSEFMGLIHGEYDAKNSDFAPGGCSLHNTMSAHGPDSQSYTQALESELEPQKYDNTLAFMFESNLTWNVTNLAMKSKTLDKNYLKAWQELPLRFIG